MDTSGLHKLQQNGEYGNYCVASSEINIAEFDPGTEIKFFELPPGIELFRVRLIYSIIATGATLQLGYALKDGSDTDLDHFLTNEAAGEDTIRRWDEVPKHFEKPVFITGVLDGANSGMGSICCVVEYVFHGVR